MLYRMAASHHRLVLVIEHIDAYAITLLDVVTDGGDMVLTFDQSLPADLAEHLELIEEP